MTVIVSTQEALWFVTSTLQAPTHPNNLPHPRNACWRRLLRCWGDRRVTKAQLMGQTDPTCNAMQYTYIHTYLPACPTYLPTYARTYVRTCVHTYVHTYVHAYMHTHVPTYLRTYVLVPTYLRTYVPTYIHTYVHTYTYTYIYIYIYRYIYIYIYIYTHTHTHTHTHTQTHTHIHIHIHIHIHTYIHTHTYIYMYIYIYIYIYIADRVANTCYVRDGAALNVRIKGIKKQRVNISRSFWIILRRWQGVRPLLRKTCIQWPVFFWVMATHSDVCVFSTYVHCS